MTEILLFKANHNISLC